LSAAPAGSKQTVATGAANISSIAAQEAAYRVCGARRAGSRKAAHSSAATPAPCQQKCSNVQPTR
jgi:hypothetical protein